MAELVERRTTWEHLGVGHILLAPDGQRYEVIAAAQPTQYQYAHTNWLRVRGEDGTEHSIAPRLYTTKVTILVDPEAPPIERSWPEGAKEQALLMEALGAIELGTQDRTTGEIWCPWTWNEEADLLHLQVAHGLDTTGLDTLEKYVATHSAAHDPDSPLSRGGFTHRHVPEDRTIL